MRCEIHTVLSTISPRTWSNHPPFLARTAADHLAESPAKILTQPRIQDRVDGTVEVGQVDCTESGIESSAEG